MSKEQWACCLYKKKKEAFQIQLIMYLWSSLRCWQSLMLHGFLLHQWVFSKHTWAIQEMLIIINLFMAQWCLHKYNHILHVPVSKLTNTVNTNTQIHIPIILQTQSQFYFEITYTVINYKILNQSMSMMGGEKTTTRQRGEKIF